MNPNTSSTTELDFPFSGTTQASIINNFSNRRIVSAFHPPCWCLRPWEIPFNGEPFRHFELINGELDEDFRALWILIFEHESHPLIGLRILQRDDDLPSTNMIIASYAELTALQRVAIETVNGRLGLLIAGEGA
ncbi:MAG: hypothetical protein B7X91_02540 [Hydrogenophilales bacterium 17-64-11]|nr:MAG: hypothetical protein B7X91_02540 [Hydrogenophilales bacterium 17-64-11]